MRLRCLAFAGTRGRKIVIARTVGLIEPSERSRDVGVEDAMVTGAKGKPSHVGQLATRHDDGSTQIGPWAGFIKPDLRQGDFRRESLGFEEVIEHTPQSSLCGNGEDARLALP